MKKNDRIWELDALRGVCILCVIAVEHFRGLGVIRIFRIFLVGIIIFDFVLVDDRHHAVFEAALFHNVAEEILHPVRQHLHQDGFDLCPQRLRNRKGAAGDLGFQRTVLEDPRHFGFGADVPGFLDVFQHGELGVHALNRGDRERGRIGVLLEAICQVMFFA